MAQNKTDARFLAFVSMTIAWETGGRKDGGYTNDPRDTGGETKWGISKRAHPSLNIKALTFNDAVRIYKDEYWNDNYTSINSNRIAFKLFDMGVLSGTKKAKRTLQTAVKDCGITIKVDGIIGPVTIAAINSIDEETLYRVYIDRLESHFRWITILRPKNKAYLKGWLRRLNYNWSVKE